MRISDAGWRLIGELGEPNKNPDNWWCVPNKWLRTARPLIRLGLVRVYEKGNATYRTSLCLTERGWQEHQKLRADRFGKKISSGVW